MHSTMNSEASHKYKPLQLMESSILLRDLLTETDQTKYTSHLRRLVDDKLLCLILISSTHIFFQLFYVSHDVCGLWSTNFLSG